METVSLAVLVGLCVFSACAWIGIRLMSSPLDTAGFSGVSEGDVDRRRADARILKRFDYSGGAWVSWNTADNQTRKLKCRLMEISEHGAAVTSIADIPLGTHVTLEMVKVKMTTTADVRRRRKSWGRYTIGLEFCRPLAAKMVTCGGRVTGSPELQ